MKIQELLAGVSVGGVTIYTFYDVITRLNAPVNLNSGPDIGAPLQFPFLPFIALTGLMFLIWLVYPKDEVPA